MEPHGVDRAIMAETVVETQANLSSLMLVVEKHFRDRTDSGGPH